MFTGLVEADFSGDIRRVTAHDSFIPLGDAANLVLLTGAIPDPLHDDCAASPGERAVLAEVRELAPAGKVAGAAVSGQAALAAAYRRLASGDGVFCEPSSAASVAGIIARVESGLIAAGETVVCVLTGHGLKDPDTAIGDGGAVQRLPADYASIEAAVLG